MKKSELRSGDVVVYRSGETRKVFLNSYHGDIIASDYAWVSLDDITEDLMSGWGDSDCDIMRVLRPKRETKLPSFNMDDLELVWDRKKYPKAELGDLVRINWTNSGTKFYKICETSNGYEMLDIECGRSACYGASSIEELLGKIDPVNDGELAILPRI